MFKVFNSFYISMINCDFLAATICIAANYGKKLKADTSKAETISILFKIAQRKLPEPRKNYVDVYWWSYWQLGGDESNDECQYSACGRRNWAKDSRTNREVSLKYSPHVTSWKRYWITVIYAQFRPLNYEELITIKAAIFAEEIGYTY